MTHEEEVVCLSLKEQMSEVSARVIAAKVFGWGLKDARQKFQKATEKRRLVGSHVVERRENLFFLKTGDRTVQITEIFLSDCSVERASELRVAMMWTG